MRWQRPLLLAGLLSVSLARAGGSNLVNGVIYSYDGESKSAFIERVRKEVQAEVDEEVRISKEVVDANLWYREMKAKAFAGYNAAWKYHCTYEDDAHLETEIKHKTRRDVEKGL